MNLVPFDRPKEAFATRFSQLSSAGGFLGMGT